MNFEESLWQACLKHGLHRGNYKPPMRLYETDRAIYVEIDGETKEFHSRDEVRDFQRSVWSADNGRDSRGE